jgi:ABC-type branched-subunit amino acid transport system ATPase component
MTVAVAEGPNSTAILEVREATVRFGGQTALDNVSITVPPASLIGLVGPNGAGKSTLFGVCSGLLRPNDGRVSLDGTVVTGASPQARARLGLARTFQQPELFMGLTVRQHVVLAHRTRQDRGRLWRDMFTGGGFRKSSDEERATVDRLLQQLSLHKLADSLVDTLPLGTTRIVEVARAVASGPRVILLDEPLSGLDANEAGDLADVLARIVTDEGISLLLVEHDVATVLRLCSNIYVLDAGRLISQGPPDTVRNDPAVKAAYLGDTPITPGPHR